MVGIEPHLIPEGDVCKVCTLLVMAGSSLWWLLDWALTTRPKAIAHCQDITLSI